MYCSSPLPAHAYEMVTTTVCLQIDKCMILKEFYGEKGGGGCSKECLKWGGWGSLRDLSKNILKQGVGKGKSCS